MKSESILPELIASLLLFGGLAIALILGAHLSACLNLDPVEPTPIVDAGPAVTCADAEARLILLGCEDMLAVCGPDEVAGTADDWSWKQWCENEDKAGVWEPIPKGCIAGAGSCAAADDCFR